MLKRHLTDQIALIIRNLQASSSNATYVTAFNNILHFFIHSSHIFNAYFSKDSYYSSFLLFYSHHEIEFHIYATNDFMWSINMKEWVSQREAANKKKIIYRCESCEILLNLYFMRRWNKKMTDNTFNSIKTDML